MENDFEIVDHSILTDGTEVATVIPNLDDWEESMLVSAVNKYDANKTMYSAYTTDSESVDDTTTIDDLNDLADNINSDIDKVLEANALIRQKIHTNPLIGRTYEAIYSNVNSRYTLEYPNPDGRNKQKTLDNAKSCIEEFNRQVNLPYLIREAIAGVVREGNRIFNLRIDGGNYVVDTYPLPIGFVTDWEVNGTPLLAINLTNLEARLKKTYQKDKKRKAIWMKDITDDIKQNYPTAYQDYVNKETYSKLDPKYARIIRINNLGRKYGVSPFFKALKDDLLIDQLAQTDLTIAKSKQRKILFQILRKELLENGKKKAITEAVYAHGELMKALATTSAVYTSSFAEDLRYVAPPNDDTNSDKMIAYRTSLMNALGIEYVNTDTGTVSVANLSMKQLMRTINAIAEQVEAVLNHYYRVVLEENGIDPIYAPTITVIDSEQLETDVAVSLASFIYSTLNGSMRTACDIIGIDYDSELLRRQEENDAKADQIFFPRATSYTTANDSEDDDSDDGDSDSKSNTTEKETETNPEEEKKSGRPKSSDDEEKQQEDEARNDDE